MVNVVNSLVVCAKTNLPKSVVASKWVNTVAPESFAIVSSPLGNGYISHMSLDTDLVSSNQRRCDTATMSVHLGIGTLTLEIIPHASFLASSSCTLLQRGNGMFRAE